METKIKSVSGYDGKYFVSNDGRVFSSRNNEKKELKQFADKDGYMIVQLSKQGKRKTMRVHRLVANAFIENPNNLPIVNHKDENKSNNHYENLEWCSYRNNIIFNGGGERRGEKLMIPVVVSKNGKSIAFHSANDAALYVNTRPHCITNCARGYRKTIKGYGVQYLYGEGRRKK